MLKLIHHFFSAALVLLLVAMFATTANADESVATAPIVRVQLTQQCNNTLIHWSSPSHPCYQLGYQPRQRSPLSEIIKWFDANGYFANESYRGFSNHTRRGFYNRSFTTSDSIGWRNYSILPEELRRARKRSNCEALMMGNICRTHLDTFVVPFSIFDLT